MHRLIDNSPHSSSEKRQKQPIAGSWGPQLPPSIPSHLPTHLSSSANIVSSPRGQQLIVLSAPPQPEGFVY